MKRGDVVYVAIPPPDPDNPSHVQAGQRPAVVVQAHSATDALQTVIVVPLTSRLRARRFPGSIEVAPSILNGLDQRSVALVHQITTIDQSNVERQVGELDSADLGRLDEALVEHLGLELDDV